MFSEKKYHAIRVDAEKCFGCTRCMQACPTEAIRVVSGLAVIADEKCVDCGNCMRACPADAFYILHDDLSFMHHFKYKVAFFPSVMIGQFPDHISDDQVYGALLELGFTHIYEVEQPIQWIADAYRDFYSQNRGSGPLISSFCPAVIRLIQIRYPSLIENIMMVKAPHDLAAHYAISVLKEQGASAEEIGMFYIAPCSAKIAAVKDPLGEKKSIINGIINMHELYNRVMKIISARPENSFDGFRENLTREGILWCLPRGEARLFKRKSMAIDGIHNVVKILEQLETGSIPEIDFLELRSCDQGCAGGILLSGNRFLTVERLERRARHFPHSYENCPESPDKQDILGKMKIDPILPASVFRLDDDLGKAVDKMANVENIVSLLPEIDCGACGAPNCHALAEDMVMGKAKMTDCLFFQAKAQKEGKISPEQASAGIEKIWGNGWFNSGLNRKGKNESF
jgi:Na+-translocating ferredoxin:NAD+ oxidoreductase RNF subunit RnfB